MPGFLSATQTNLVFRLLLSLPVALRSFPTTTVDAADAGNLRIISENIDTRLTELQPDSPVPFWRVPANLAGIDIPAYW